MAYRLIQVKHALTNTTHSPETKKRERFFLLSLAGIQFTHILDFMIMMPLGPEFIRVFNINTHQFGLLLSSYTFAAALAGIFATYYIDRFERRQILLSLYAFLLLLLWPVA